MNAEISFLEQPGKAGEFTQHLSAIETVVNKSTQIGDVFTLRGLRDEVHNLRLFMVNDDQRDHAAGLIAKIDHALAQERVPIVECSIDESSSSLSIDERLAA